MLKWLLGKSPRLAETAWLVREACNSPTGRTTSPNQSDVVVQRIIKRCLNVNTITKAKKWRLFCKIGSLEVCILILMKVPFVWNPLEMSCGATAVICNYASFLAQNFTNQLHYPFYSLYWTPHNFLSKTEAIVKGLRFSTGDFPDV